MLTNISIVYLPNGKWQLWDGPEGINGKSEVADYSQRIVWVTDDCSHVYIGQTAYHGDACVTSAEKPRNWPFNEIDRSVT